MLDSEGMELYDQPLSSSLGIQSQLPILLSEYVFYTRQDVEDYLSLLSSIDTYYESIVEYEKQKSEAGLGLCDTAIDRIIQNRERVHPGTYLGKGKIEEVRERAAELHATGIVCDDELSPAQLRNLEDALQIKVMDRTMVILDIFASHAVTREGKIQVELAQLRYRAARLVGLRNSLSRLGGGIGTRGPGEKKLEVDRRLIHERIGQLKSELENVKRHREVARQQRDRNCTVSAAIVGYTNAGKSTPVSYTHLTLPTT